MLEDYECTSEDGEIICPKCGYKNNSGAAYDHESLPWGEDERQDYQCTQCDAQLEVVCYSISYAHRTELRD